MGIFEGLDAEPYDRKYSDRVLLKRIFDYFKPHRGKLVVVVILAILISLASAATVLVISRAVDLIKTSPTVMNISLIAGIGLFAGVFIWVANWSGRRTMVQAIAGVVVMLATDAFEAATQHDLSFYDEYSSGRIVSRNRAGVHCHLQQASRAR